MSVVLNSFKGLFIVLQTWHPKVALDLNPGIFHVLS